MTKLARPANFPNNEKSAAVRDYGEHLQRDTSDWTHYKVVQVGEREYAM